MPAAVLLDDPELPCSADGRFRTRMTFTIVIVTYRSAESIEACIGSVPNDHRRDIVVIENNSGDDAASIARSMGVAVVENPRNSGFGAAANQGAALGSSELILFLNPDARLPVGALDQLASAFEDPSVGVVGAHLVGFDGTPQRSWWRYPSPGAMWKEALGLYRFSGRDHAGFVVGACFAVRRSLFESLGGFDERFARPSIEDIELGSRLIAAGHRIRLRRSLQVKHLKRYALLPLLRSDVVDRAVPRPVEAAHRVERVTGVVVVVAVRSAADAHGLSTKALTLDKIVSILSQPFSIRTKAVEMDPIPPLHSPVNLQPAFVFTHLPQFETTIGGISRRK